VFTIIVFYIVESSQLAARVYNKPPTYLLTYLLTHLLTYRTDKQHAVYKLWWQYSFPIFVTFADICSYIGKVLFRNILSLTLWTLKLRHIIPTSR